MEAASPHALPGVLPHRPQAVYEPLQKERFGRRVKGASHRQSKERVCHVGQVRRSAKELCVNVNGVDAEREPYRVPEPENASALSGTDRAEKHGTLAFQQVDDQRYRARAAVRMVPIPSLRPDRVTRVSCRSMTGW
ncbi:hypothetical protein GCM10018771_44390 [Streptomyces cellulosae]|nr:hypothetical protein GCM10018771_44390 [Streptomyces cellulosae]